VLLDLVMPGVDGMAVLERLSQKPGIPPIIVQTAHGSIDAAINAMRAGAADFVIKPASPERVEVSIKSALKIEALSGEISRIKKKVEGTLTFNDLIIRGEAMQRVISLGKRAASSNIPVLIEGESGVGKELIARAIQGESERAGKPFITVNCGAIPENLVESILFGHEKGSFTGASEKRIGKFQEADGGTLFLDEVGELPLDAQVKLLRALQEGEIDPVGSKKPVNVNFRLISATNRDMIQLVKDGKFREDLYYRLNVFPIWVPPLRERVEDVPELAQHFVARFAAEEGKRVSGLAPDALSLIKTYSWPGNVRQLENAVFRAVVLSDRPELTINEFPQIAAHVEGFDAEIPEAPSEPMRKPIYTGPALLGAEDRIPQTVEVKGGTGGSSLGIPAVDASGDIRPLEAIEADMIRLALGRYRGHMTEVAKRLNIGRSTLYRKMQEYGLEQRVN
jgi:DNA-binding NtrC family response regulator